MKDDDCLRQRMALEKSAEIEARLYLECVCMRVGQIAAASERLQCSPLARSQRLDLDRARAPDNKQAIRSAAKIDALVAARGADLPDFEHRIRRRNQCRARVQIDAQPGHHFGRHSCEASEVERG